MTLKKITTVLCLLWLSVLQLAFAGLEEDFQWYIECKNFQTAGMLLQQKESWPADLLVSAFIKAVDVKSQVLDTEFIHLLVEKGVDLKKQSILVAPLYKITPIQFVLLKEHEAFFAQLLNRNLQAISAKDSQNETLLHLAAAKGYSYLSSALVAHGLDVNAIGHQNKTPLHYAAQYGHTETVNFLCDLGADVNAQSGRGDNTPLIEAICARGHALWDKLFEYKDFFTALGQPLTQDVEQKKYYALIYKLLKGETLDCNDDLCLCPTCRLTHELRNISARYHAIIQTLLQNNADVSIRCQSDGEYTALHAAITRHDMWTFQQLLPWFTGSQLHDMHSTQCYSPMTLTWLHQNREMSDALKQAMQK